MTNSKEEKTNKNKKPNTNAVAKPKVKAGTPVLTNCMLMMPVDITGVVKEIKKKIKKKQ